MTDGDRWEQMDIEAETPSEHLQQLMGELLLTIEGGRMVPHADADLSVQLTAEHADVSEPDDELMGNDTMHMAIVLLQVTIERFEDAERELGDDGD